MKIEYIGKCLLIEEAGERVLVIGDLHLGYEGAMRTSGVMIPVKLYEKCIADFDEVVSFVNREFDKKIINKKNNGQVHGSYAGLVGNELSREVRDENIERRDNEKKIDKIIILGDVKHEFGFILQDEWNKIGGFLEHLKEKCKEIIVIEGNHDAILFPILKKMGIVGIDYYLWKEFAFIHGDKEFEEIYDLGVKYWVLGHGHPAVNLYEGAKRESYKCFLTGLYKRKKVILVPSFFPLISGTDAREFDLNYAWDFNLGKFDVKVVGDGLNVLDFGKLGDIN